MTSVDTSSPAAPTLDHVVVVGASLAGLRACESLRTEGFAGQITLVGAEPHLPYDRPPLSKRLLSGEWEPERIQLRKPDDFDALGLQLELGRRAVGLDSARGEVTLDDGRALRFDGLVIATGASPRRLPEQSHAGGIHELRTLDDALALRAELREGARLVVIGAGFIGLEVAATARAAGCSVSVVEALPAPLVRGLGAEMGAAVAQVHARHGVDLRCDTRISGIAMADGRVTGVELEGGELLPADVVVVGIGVTPATDWLDSSGLTIADGVVCDATLCTGVPGIYAAGDVARWPHPLYGEEMRAEHWTNAAEQGALAARNLLAAAAGQPTAAYDAVPFVWSDQFTSRIQFLGRSAAQHADTVVEVVAGDPEEGPFVALYGRAGRLWGVLGVSMPRLVMPYRAMLAAGATWEQALEKARGAA